MTKEDREEKFARKVAEARERQAAKGKGPEYYAAGKMNRFMAVQLDGHIRRAEKQFAKRLDKKPVGAREDLQDGQPLFAGLNPLNNVMGSCNYHTIYLSHGWKLVETRQVEIRKIGLPQRIMKVDTYEKVEGEMKDEV